MQKVTRQSIQEAKAKAEAALPERLKRLNREMMIERSIDFDNELYATRNGHRFRISVFRHPVHGFVATTKAAGYVRRYNGATPVDAFFALVNTLHWVVSRLDYERNLLARGDVDA